MDKISPHNNKEKKNNKLKNIKVLSFEVVSNVFEKKRRKKEISNKAKNQTQDLIIKNSRKDNTEQQVSNKTILQNDSIRQKLISYFGDPTYRSLFNNVRFDEITPSKVVMSVPHNFRKQYIESDYIHHLEKIFNEEKVHNFAIQIKIDETLKSIFEEEDTSVESNEKSLQDLTQKQKIKVANYAAKLCKSNLCKGYAASIEKVELTKQMMHHVLHWRPTSNPYISPEDEFEVSLKVAYSKIKAGNWNMPQGYK